jgi:ABC-type multidrug transport system fused ATPase/permease subunit
VYAFAGYRLLPALQTIYNQLSMIRYHGELLKSLNDDLRVLSATSLALPPASQVNAPRRNFRQNIQFSNVQFSYPGASQPALNTINLTIPFRSRVGIVGASGSGKTTAMDVLLGLLLPQSGSLVLDDQPLSMGDLSGWQRNLGYVPQHIYLTDESIAGNIAFGVPQEEIDMEAVLRAAKIANLHDFVMTELPLGYSTLVGERGVRLSGGQRQRIGIARSLYHDPEVLILDEATSALDNLTERAVMDAINNLHNQKTIVMVAHRLTTVMSCDCIYLLDHGKAVASGTYEQLLEENARFKAMAGTP